MKLTYKQVAKAIGISESTARRDFEQEDLEAITEGVLADIDWDYEILEWVRENYMKYDHLVYEVVWAETHGEASDE